MLRIIFILLPFVFFACGVKAPPIAPTRAPVPVEQNLDCSPKDPNCDAIDPNYKP